MADPTATSVEVKDGKLTIIGSNFTQTTTTVFVDGAETDYEFVSATELTLDPAPDTGASVEVEKGGVRTEPLIVEAPADRQTAPGATGVVTEDANSTGPMTPSQPYPEGTPTATQVAPPPTPADYMTEQEKNPDPGPLTETREMGSTVAETNPVAPREPYPTGNPPDPEEAFYQAHGYYRRTPGGEAPREVTGDTRDELAGRPETASPNPAEPGRLRRY